MFEILSTKDTHKQQLSQLTSMKKPKNSLKLPNPTRYTHKFRNKLMTDTSCEINLQRKQDVISSRSESETSNDYG